MKSSSIKSLNGGAGAALVISFVLLILMWHLTTPTSGGPLGILFVFILVYILFTSLILVLTGFWTIFSRNILGRPGMIDRRRYYVSSVLGFLPVLYLTLLSMGGATIWGVLLVFLFIILMLFYVLRRST